MRFSYLIICCTALISSKAADADAKPDHLQKASIFKSKTKQAQLTPPHALKTKYFKKQPIKVLIYTAQQSARKKSTWRAEPYRSRLNISPTTHSQALAMSAAPVVSAEPPAAVAPSFYKQPSGQASSQNTPSDPPDVPIPSAAPSAPAALAEPAAPAAPISPTAPAAPSAPAAPAAPSAPAALAEPAAPAAPITPTAPAAPNAPAAPAAPITPAAPSAPAAPAAPIAPAAPAAPITPAAPAAPAAPITPTAPAAPSAPAAQTAQDSWASLHSPSGGLTLQVASVPNAAQAAQLKSVFEKNGHQVDIQEVEVNGLKTFRIRVGRFENNQNAKKAYEIILKKYRYKSIIRKF